MILDIGKYYLYRHIRLDKNEVFYVGIGTKSPARDGYNHYRRAFDKRFKTKYWKNITNKTEYRVEIILESDNYEFIKQKEKDFIKLYGRRDLGLGTLVNMTDGGEGQNNRIVSEKQKLQMSLRQKGKKLTPETRIKCLEALKRGNKTRMRVCYCYDLEGNFVREFESMTQASIILNGNKEKIKQIYNACKGFKNSGKGKISNIGQVLGYYWSFNKKEFHKVIIKKEWSEERRNKFVTTFKEKNKKIKVINTQTNQKIIFQSILDLQKTNNWSKTSIYRSIKNNSIIYKKFIVKFVKNVI